MMLDIKQIDTMVTPGLQTNAHAPDRTNLFTTSRINQKVIMYETCFATKNCFMDKQ